MNKKEFELMIQESVKKALVGAKKKPVKKISRSQLAEGVRKAMRMVLSESGMPGGAMPVPGMGAGMPTTPPANEALSDGDGTTKKRGVLTSGVVPSPEELQAALDDIGGWSWDIQGGDYLAYSYAMSIQELGHPDMDTGTGMHQVLTALANAPSPEELPHDMDDYVINDPHSEFNRALDSWENRYGMSGEKIEERAQSLASDIMDHLGWEWV
jgi:hypothetical protein